MMNKYSLLFLLILLIFHPQANLAAQSTDRLEYTFPHRDEVRGAVWSPDGSRIMSWSQDGAAYVWDSVSGIQLFNLDHDDVFYGPSFSPDGKYILSFKEDTLFVWDASDGRQKYAMKQIDKISDAVWFPTSAQIATWGTKFDFSGGTSSSDIFVQIWNVSDGTLQAVMLLQNGFVQVVKPNRDGTQIATQMTGEVGGIRVWDTNTGEEITALRQDGSLFGTVGDVAWSSDNQHILVSGITGKAFIADSLTGEHQVDFLNDDWIWSAFRSPDETRVAGLFINSRTTPIWDAQTADELLNLHHDDYVVELIWSEDSKRLLTSSNDGNTGNTITLWDAVAGTKLLEFHREAGSVSASWSSDETRILGWFWNPFHSAEEGEFVVWDSASGTELLSQSHDGIIAGAYKPVWSPVDNRLLSWRGSQVFVWDLG